jgi:prevent-host-death family protein
MTEATMATTYSTYEAKAKFSEIMRKVREGKHVYISYRGKEVAEIRPLQKEDSLEDRLRRLEEEGLIGPPAEPKGKLEPIADRPGALERFLESRD